MDDLTRCRFGDCELDLATFEVRREGAPVHVEPQVCEVLVHLVRNRDRVVARTELLDHVWGDRFVGESALTSRDQGRPACDRRRRHGRLVRVRTDDERREAAVDNAVRFLRVFGAIDVTALAPQVRRPTLILHARGDLRVPLSQARELASLFPGAQLVPLHSRNHILCEREPAWPVFLHAVDGFLADEAMRRQASVRTRPPAEEPHRGGGAASDACVARVAHTRSASYRDART